VASGARNGIPHVDAPAISKRDATPKPPRLVLNAVEGWGKTTVGAYGPNPVIIMARGETGYDTLLQHGLVPSVDAAMVDSWPQLFALLDVLKEQKHTTIVLDALGGFETLCHEHVCNRDYKGDWGPKGFMNYAKGPHTAARDWEMMLAKLDELHALGKCILILSHSLVKSVKDPLVEDYDKYIVDCDKKTWGVTAKWTDAILFGNFRSIVDDKGDRNKGIGGKERVVYTENNDAYIAKNRLAMPEEIVIPDDPTKGWQAIRDAIGNGAAAK